MLYLSSPSLIIVSVQHIAVLKFQYPSLGFRAFRTICQIYKKNFVCAYLPHNNSFWEVFPKYQLLLLVIKALLFSFSSLSFGLQISRIFLQIRLFAVLERRVYLLFHRKIKCWNFSRFVFFRLEKCIFPSHKHFISRSW